MEIKVDKWYIDKKTFELPIQMRREIPVLVTKIFKQDGEPWVLYLDHRYWTASGLTYQSLADFEKFYEEYDGDISEFNSKVLGESFKKAVVQAANYIEWYQVHDAKIDEQNKELRQLRRENRILKVLADGKRQTQWEMGELIPGRVAKCSSCGELVLSETSLPFFKERPDHDTDEYYCGCYGFD